MEHLYWYGLIEEQLLTCHKRGYFVVLSFCSACKVIKIAGQESFFLILGIVIFESLEWCENPVSLRIATKLSGVIMAYVLGETHFSL